MATKLKTIPTKTNIKPAAVRPLSPSDLPFPRIFPRIDEHLIEPGVSRFELIRGRRVDAFGVDAPQGDVQARAAFLMSGHVITGFVVSLRLLTRMGWQSDFSSNVCIRKGGIDPQTNTRYLEELAFVIADDHTNRDALEKAEDMALRGVRRVVGIFVKTNQVCEWCAKKGAFIPFRRDGIIEDLLFVRPLPVEALLDPAKAREATRSALIAKHHSVVTEHQQDR